MRLAWILVPLAALASCDDQNAPQAFDAAVPDAGASDAAPEAEGGGADVAPRGTRVLGAGLDIGDPSFYDDLAVLTYALSDRFPG